MAENILHFAAVRLRLNGSGNLQVQLRSLDDANIVDLTALTMSETSGIEPTRLCNFISQRARYKVYVTKRAEYFRINRIIMYARQIWTQYPGTS